jgi:aarF domain-containing kinase
VQVPSFPDDIAMALIEEELGKPWQEIYSELSPSPIAAGEDWQFDLGLAENLVSILFWSSIIISMVFGVLYILREVFITFLSWLSDLHVTCYQTTMGTLM